MFNQYCFSRKELWLILYLIPKSLFFTLDVDRALATLEGLNIYALIADV